MIGSERILRADSKGRILLGSEFAGSFLGVTTSTDGIFLQRMQVVPIQNPEKKKSSENILKFAGAWEDMSDSDFEEFQGNIKTRRKASSKRAKI